ncbi:hypothetical protein NKH18_50245 [Streptomyces sp. M10(2022)]
MALRGWQPQQWATAGACALLTAVLVGVPTAVFPSPLFSRSVPVQWWNYPVLAVTAVLAGLVLSTYVRRPATPRTPESAPGGRLGSLGGLLSFLAVGCPVCNKVVLLLLGTSGALSYWAPLQPLVAIASAVLLAEAAVRRLSVQAACPVPTPA